MDSDSDSTAEDASHPEVPARAGAPIPAPPGGREEGSGEGQGRRPSWAERTRRLGAVLYRRQFEALALLPLWACAARLAIPGWGSILYILMLVPATFVLQLLVMARSRLTAQRSDGIHRMSQMMVWSYLAFLICALVLPLILPDNNDCEEIDSLLTAAGVDHGTAYSISTMVFWVGAISLLGSLIGAGVPAREEPRSALAQ